MVFTRRRKWQLPFQLSVDSVGIPVVKSVKYLGVWLDSSLGWGPHIQYTSEKALRVLFACNKAIGKSWGLSPKVSRWVYVALVRPILEYCSVVWSHSLEVKARLAPISKVHRLACLMVSRAYRSAPTECIEILAGVQPIQLFLQGRAMLTANRLSVNGHWENDYQAFYPGRLSSHALLVDSWRAQVPLLSGPIDCIPPLLVVDRPFSVVILPRAEATETASILKEDAVSVFTDGSKDDTGTGAGFVCWAGSSPLGSSSFSLGSSPTVFQCEVYAISRACEFILSLGSVPSSVYIFSDSQAALRALNRSIIKSKLIQECLSLLSAVASRSQVVVLSWVPGHSGIHGNEKADELARAGSRQLPVGPEPFITFSPSLFKAGVREWTELKQQERLGSSSISKKSQIPSQALLDTQFSPSTHSHQGMWILSQLISGHSALNYFQNLIGHVNEALCSDCGEAPETSEHFLCSCSAFSPLRISTFGISPVSLDYLLYYCSTAQLIRYGSRSGRFDRGKFSGRPPS